MLYDGQAGTIEHKGVVDTLFVGETLDEGELLLAQLHFGIITLQEAATQLQKMELKHYHKLFGIIDELKEVNKHD